MSAQYTTVPASLLSRRFLASFGGGKNAKDDKAEWRDVYETPPAPPAPEPLVTKVLPPLYTPTFESLTEAAIAARCVFLSVSWVGGVCAQLNDETCRGDCVCIVSTSFLSACMCEWMSMSMFVCVLAVWFV